MGAIDAYTKLLLHCNGADASTTFDDASTSNHTMTVVANAQVDTAFKKFGSGSALFDGTGDALTAVDHADWEFAAGDFCIDFWVRFNSVASIQALTNHQYAKPAAGEYGWSIFWHTGNLLYFRYSVDGTNLTDKTFAWTPSTNTQYHVAVSRNSADLRAFILGTQIGSTESMGTDNINDSTEVLRIGLRRTDTATFDLDFNGWLDEIRISKGIARWTANFTPPNREYGMDEGSFLLNFV